MKECVNPTCARDLADDTEVCGNCGTRQPSAQGRSTGDTGSRRNQAVGDTSADRGGVAQGGSGNVQVKYNFFFGPGATTSTPVPTPTPTPTATRAPTPTPAQPPVFLAKWGSQGSGDGQFQQPYSVAVNGAGNVYVADSNNHRIQKFGQR